MSSFLTLDPESNGGLYLVRRGEFNLGAHINVFFRIRCKTSAGLGASRELKIAFADKRHISFFGKGYRQIDLVLMCLLFPSVL